MKKSPEVYRLRAFFIFWRIRKTRAVTGFFDVNRMGCMTNTKAHGVHVGYKKIRA